MSIARYDIGAENHMSMENTVISSSLLYYVNLFKQTIHFSSHNYHFLHHSHNTFDHFFHYFHSNCFDHNHHVVTLIDDFDSDFGLFDRHNSCHLGRC